MSKRSRPNTEVKMDMTPMIDVTFLLVIFFIIVNDMSQRELEDLKLPIAMQAGHDEPPPRRPILNVLPDGKVIWKGKTLWKEGMQPDANQIDPLHKGRPDYRYKLAQQLARFAADMDTEVDVNLGALPDEPILIRADRNTEFKHISKIMEVCTRPDIRIWKVQLAASEPEAGAKKE